MVVDGTGGIVNCFVYVKKGLEAYRFPVESKPALLDQVKCRYEPHVLGVMAGQEVVIRNSDKTDRGHNVKGMPSVNNGFNFLQPDPGMESKVTFAVPEIGAFVKCDIHGWMGAYVCVVAHPIFAVTGADGKFKLPKLNPGDYEIEVWHEKLKTQTKKVTLKANGTESIEVVYKK